MQSKSIRPALLILVALLLSSRTLMEIAKGNMAISSAGVDLVAAIMVSWIGVGTVGWLVDTYHATVMMNKQRASLNKRSEDQNES